eukprot:COSAG03_NODE_186_length_10940_cov_2.632967_9_plen_46_part_00
MGGVSSALDQLRLISRAPTLSAGDGVLQTIRPNLDGAAESEACQS